MSMIQHIVCCAVNLWHVSWSRDFQSVWSPPMRVSTWACTCSGPTAPPWGSVCRRHLEAPHPRDVIISTPWRTVRKPVWIRPGPENASLWNLQCTVVLRAATSSLAKKNNWKIMNISWKTAFRVHVHTPLGHFKVVSLSFSYIQSTC